jgi:hypothetical protein
MALENQVIEEVKSLLPNFEEDGRFKNHQKYHGTGSWLVARDMVVEGRASEDFQKLELNYRDFFNGDCTETVYAIGYGPIHSGGKEQSAILFLRRWYDNPGIREGEVEALELIRLREFTLLEKKP